MADGLTSSDADSTSRIGRNKADEDQLQPTVWNTLRKLSRPTIKNCPTADRRLGDKGDRGERGTPGKPGIEGSSGPRGSEGLKGDKGQAGAPGDACKSQHSAFSVGRRKSLHSVDNYQALIFDTIFVNTPEHFGMFAGKYRCHIPGIYFFNVNIHTWNFKETYLHIMQNDSEKAIVYAQPSDRSIMQSQSVMLPLQEGDEVWVRLYKRERENAIYSDDVDVYITFNGYLIKPETE
ncbi:Complement C1q tumor necrosis factor-related protein 1 [Anabarilius grahami]|uniref:Complement C1q tumor necrosis factor-related protein 1 n=1 Tax=Anabarilius grahami TaxID=495550 RepID=A0A3N0YAZ0_ANAGA|nr:Complement C1q tumor necrosis factor-related protein 1 [Anabarilius grahami]